MKIIIDEREKQLYDTCYSILLGKSTASHIILSKEVLPLGDILLRTDDDKDVLLIERKTFSDLFASIKDGRYEEQSYRLLHSSQIMPHSIIYLIEGVLSQLHTPLEKKVLYSTMTSLNYFKGFSVHRSSGVRESAEWLLQMGEKIEKNFQKNKLPYYLTDPFLNHFRSKQRDSSNNDIEITEENQIQTSSADYCRVVKKVKKDNINNENFGQIILCQIPGISSTTALAIMKNYSTFPDFIQKLQENPNCLDDVVYETNGKTRKISKSCIANIKNFLLLENN
jgi:ERCC4-type nuclease